MCLFFYSKVILLFSLFIYGKKIFFSSNSFYDLLSYCRIFLWILVVMTRSSTIECLYYHRIGVVRNFYLV